MIEYIMFDLDGTLTDPGEGITNSVMYALEKYNIHTNDRSELYRFIGPPLLDSFSRFYDFSPDDCRLAVKYYREYFADKGIFENKLYDGVTDMLSELKNSGKKIALATSKPEEFAVRILEHFDIAKYFDVFAGASMDETRSRKSEVIEHALRLSGISDKSGTVMVGDREHDVLGAKEHGVRCIGVLYGYGALQELEDAGAWRVAADIDELRRLLLN